MTKRIPVYDIGLNESLEAQHRKQKALAERFGVSVGQGEKLFYPHSGLLVSSTQGLIPRGTLSFEQELRRYEEAVCR